MPPEEEAIDRRYEDACNEDMKLTATREGSDYGTSGGTIAGHVDERAERGGSDGGKASV